MNHLPALPSLPADALRRLQALLASGQRKLLGLAGAPGAGKSTLAAALLDAAGPGRAQVVPMDGFHLATVELQRLGRAGRKGAPDTFDSAGYVALLQRLRDQQGDDGIVYAPEFRRDIEEPVAGAIPVLPSTQLVITEGNYLLHDVDPWRDVARLLSESWYVDLDDAIREQRLFQRHRRFGRSAEAAQAWIESTDAPNAQLIAATKSRANYVLTWS